MKTLALITALLLAPQDRSDVPLEVEPSDASLSKIVIIAGSFSKGKGEHEYFAGSALLMKMLKQTPGVAPVMAAEGWPKNERILENAKSIVFYMDGGGKQPILQPEKLQLIEKLAARGVGIVHLHQIIDYPKTHTDRILPLIGGVWVPGAGARGHWDGVFDSFVDHPITRGVAPFKENDGFIYKLKFVEGMKGITPLLRTTPPKGTLKDSEDIVSWAYQRPDGGRSFVFTGCHLHESWGLESMRRFATNGILWSAGLEVPAGGAPVALESDELKKNLDPLPAKK
ncbi:MAG TPA: ThuA domain-containing protein [Planctomycetota bacterium]|jgi:type 1 glutamine amidotransferase|nr:ThuA domain-containing protein [Planctomycetota bacterium]